MENKSNAPSADLPEVETVTAFLPWHTDEEIKNSLLPGATAEERVTSFMVFLHHQLCWEKIKKSVEIENDGKFVTLQFSIPPNKVQQFREEQRARQGIKDLHARLEKISTEGIKPPDAAETIYKIVLDAIALGAISGLRVKAQEQLLNLNKDKPTQDELAAEAVEALAKVQRDRPSLGKTTQKKRAAEELKIGMSQFYERLKWARDLKIEFE